MAIPRPKILTAVTVATGGWYIIIDISKAFQFDTQLSCGIPAGTYYIAGDNQSDDLLFALQTVIQDQLDASGIGAAGYVAVDIHPTTHKIRIQFFDAFFETAMGRQVQIEWSVSNASLPPALGFVALDENITGTDDPIFTADYQHAYGWYAEQDGQLENLTVVDVDVPKMLQGISVSGVSKAMLIGGHKSAELRLNWLDRDLTFSDDGDYGDTAVYPYAQNKALECWWKEARQGKQFRVYRDGYIVTTRAGDLGARSGTNTTTLTDATKAWGTDPQRWKSREIYINDYGTINGITVTQRFFIASHTATVLTVANAHPSGLNVSPTWGAAYWLFDHTYQTYVLDTQKMREFAPNEIEAIDKYGITIPLIRYVA